LSIAIPGDAARRGVDVDRQAVLDRLAHVEGLEQREFFARAEDLFGEPLHHLLACARRLPGPAPVGEGGACRGHGSVDVDSAATRHRGQHPAVDRRGALELLAGQRVDASAIDQRAPVERLRRSARVPIDHSHQNDTTTDAPSSELLLR
jgi:hypothetical protein